MADPDDIFEPDNSIIPKHQRLLSISSVRTFTNFGCLSLFNSIQTVIEKQTITDSPHAHSSPKMSTKRNVGPSLIFVSLCAIASHVLFSFSRKHHDCRLDHYFVA